MKSKVFIIAISFFLFVSCQNKESNISEQLYNVLIDYQTKNPLPTKENTSKTFYLISKNLRYVYEASFYKDGSLYITLNPSGVNVEEKSYGIYQDNILKPTYIIDDDKAGKNFIIKYVQKDLDKFTMNKAPIIDVIYPTYIYKIKGDKLVLSDSIRGNNRK